MKGMGDQKFIFKEITPLKIYTLAEAKNWAYWASNLSTHSVTVLP
jgi:hypothetical protein